MLPSDSPTGSATGALGTARDVAESLRCPIEWPGGAAFALSVSWDIDMDTTLLLEHADVGFREYEVLSSLRYEDVAIGSVVRALSALGLRQTFFVAAWCLERYQDVCRAIVAGGHEIAHHGYMHEPVNRLDRDTEERLLLHGSDVVQRFSGVRPVGWRAPYAAFSQYSADLLCEHGFQYDSSLSSDHDPFIVDCSSGTLVELPIHVSMSDAPHYSHVPAMAYLMQPKTPEDAMKFFAAEVEATRRTGGFLTTVWHPEISGRPSRLLAWAEAIGRIQERGDAWIAPLEEIARHVKHWDAAHEGAVRRVRMPYYTSRTVPNSFR